VQQPPSNGKNGSNPEPKSLAKTLEETGNWSGVSMWTRPFTRFHRVPVFKRIWIYLLFVAVYTFIVDMVEVTYPATAFKEAGPAGAYGSIVLGLLLVFRTNSAYERWWEGRKLWGQLVNDSRNIALKVRSLKVPAAQKHHFGELVISFSYALKHHLRGTYPSEPLPGIGKVQKDEIPHLPLHITQSMFNSIAAWEAEGLIKDYKMLMLDVHARAFMDICGACERIKSSPIAVSYRAFMRQGIALNLLAWPWFLTQQFGAIWSIPPILLGAYFLIGIELIAEGVEEPFGKDEDDLPLDDICAGIKRSVNTILETDSDRKYTGTFEKPRIDVLKQ
jgi:ion channel-forming bestrophin family protein